MVDGAYKEYSSESMVITQDDFLFLDIIVGVSDSCGP